MTALLFAYAFYLGFALCIGVYRQWLKGTLNLFNKIVFAPVIIAFGLVDVLLNYTVFMVFGMPPLNCYTISARLEFYHYFGTGFQRNFATVFCEKLLNPIDPSGEHC